MPTFDCDAYHDRLYATHRARLLHLNGATVLGVRWPVLRDLPYEMMQRLLLVLEESAQAMEDAPNGLPELGEAETAFFWEVLETVFGAEAVAAWRANPDFDSFHAGGLIAWITSNYNEQLAESLLALEDPEGNPTNPDGALPSGTSTAPSSPTSAATTASGSPDLAS